MSSYFPVFQTKDPRSAADRAAILANPGFGAHFTDHMASALWTPDDGWHARRVGPLEPFTLHPGAAVLHYAQEIFEGLKAYRHADGSVWLFRPEANARRFARSARRLTLPELPEDDFIESVEALIRADEAWVPMPTGEESLYVRPFMFASEAYLGVRPAERVVYAVIAWPAGPIFASGIAGVTLWVSSKFTRSSKGGTGTAKFGGNYAASLAAQVEAHQHGCDQVMYLDSTGGTGNLEESGTMNMFLITSDGQLLTPALGTILEGTTRDTILTLAPDFGLTPVERPISLAELRSAAADGIVEAFATGTAAVITPIIRFKGDGYEFVIGSGMPGKQTLELRDHVLAIQYGRVEDSNGWMRRVL